MGKKRILLQLDTDSQTSVFDAVVACDSGVDVLLRHQAVTPENVRELVHGAIFTRGMDDLKSTAIFIGGSDVSAGERLAEAVAASFFGPLRVSVMMDANGANTTAAAAVLVAAAEASLAGSEAAVLGATGPVGQRVARLLAREGARVRVVSRVLTRAEAVCQRVRAAVGDDCQVEALAAATKEELVGQLAGVETLVAAGAAGVRLVDAIGLKQISSLRVAIDLNAVPPEGIEGIGGHDDGQPQGNVRCYGALAVGGRKMRIHKASIRRLFESNDAVLDADEIYEIGRRLDD